MNEKLEMKFGGVGRIDLLCKRFYERDLIC
jgi:hypothetical protein